ncbi:MAG: phosphoadenylyl-sulfate reductase, partial [Acidobacteriaceae bacterium]|nr:phosphoadenylyl-sulfate reductase [Acidobacteriaceae bacterium]
HTYSSRFAIVTSFQAEGMVLVDMAARMDPNVRVVTIDTGRLPDETYEMIETVRERYQIRVETIAPAGDEVAAMVTRFGPNLFYQDTDKRKLCCEIRKVRPLGRKLAEVDAYAVGLRREQSELRADVLKTESDQGRLKLSPLADWTRAEVWRYVAENDVPVHPLYARGYASIGCGPCTRAIAPGDGERAGRWWWENDAAKECGIHVSPDGRMQRQLDVMLDEVLTR